MCEEYEPVRQNKELLMKKLEKLYQCKCGQVEKARTSSNSLRYKVLMAEAEVIKTELEHYF